MAKLVAVLPRYSVLLVLERIYTQLVAVLYLAIGIIRVSADKVKSFSEDD
jgi:hypothetical protein